VLHIAAAEGHDHIVQFVLQHAPRTAHAHDRCARVCVRARVCRWGRRAIDDARQFNHHTCVQTLLQVDNDNQL
jgi:hypothetical protein